MSRTVYVCIDIETDGPIPGENSMRSVGAVPIYPSGKWVAEPFYKVLAPLPCARPDLNTLRWWQAPERAQEWRKLNDPKNWLAPRPAMHALLQWVEELPVKTERLVAAYWKPGYDMAFMRYYSRRFLGAPILSHHADGLDIKTLYALASDGRYRRTQLADVPVDVRGSRLPRHHALCDAIEQARVLAYSLDGLGAQL